MPRATPLLLVLALLVSGCGARPAAALTAVPPEGGRYRLWQDASIFVCVRQLLDGATSGQALWVEMYEFGRADLASALTAARDRGADVRVVVDRTVPESARTASRLAAAGVAVRAYPVDDRRHQIDHVKLLLAGDTAVVGGMNWGRSSAANHDYALETGAEEVVLRLRAIFAQDWTLAGGAPAPLRAAAGPVAQTSPGEEVRDRLLGALRLSRHSVDAELFVLTDPDVLAELASVRRRGGRVRVLLDPGQDASRPSFELLRAAGVEARWYPLPPGAKLHAKAALFDGRRLLLGSANWSQGGLSVNHELDLMADDPAAATAFARRFDRDWSASGG